VTLISPRKCTSTSISLILTHAIFNYFVFFYLYCQTKPPAMDLTQNVRHTDNTHRHHTQTTHTDTTHRHTHRHTHRQHTQTTHTDTTHRHHTQTHTQTPHTDNTHRHHTQTPHTDNTHRHHTQTPHNTTLDWTNLQSLLNRHLYLHLCLSLHLCLTLYLSAPLLSFLSIILIYCIFSSLISSYLHSLLSPCFIYSFSILSLCPSL
jgi:cation transport ATPase